MGKHSPCKTCHLGNQDKNNDTCRKCPLRIEYYEGIDRNDGPPGSGRDTIQYSPEGVHHVKKSQDSAIIDYIEEKGGQIKRQRLLSSKILEGVQEYDQELEALVSAGQIVVTKNGSRKGGWIYSIK